MNTYEIGATMNDLRQAAQQALEALEALEDERYVSTQIVDAITALREALKQPEQETTFFCVNCNKNVTQGCFAPNCRPHWGEKA